jgi:hypothetical protein
MPGENYPGGGFPGGEALGAAAGEALTTPGPTVTLLSARRAFPVAQQLLAGVPILTPPLDVSVGWYDTALDPERGSFAVVAEGGEHEDLIGEVIAVTYRGRSVNAYVLGARGISTEFALQRRAFLAIAVPSTESVQAQAEVLA